jgi:hypothetical protein
LGVVLLRQSRNNGVKDCIVLTPMRFEERGRLFVGVILKAIDGERQRAELSAPVGELSETMSTKLAV